MKKGSALLVVLGMLSFMVISAVAFSAFMRYSRLPSSYLRQSSASRLLAKAALAHAIDEIDAAIGNMPHPGLWNREGDLKNAANRYYYPRRNGTQLNRNIWMDRVYVGNRGDDEGFVQDHLVKPYVEYSSDGQRVNDLDGTVTVLTLEGLAYVPPPLVAAARYYSRRSNAAKWKTLAFDSGRYAFCAIDVSDYFDVNAMAANVGRSSSSAGRISLAHLFERPEQNAGDANAHSGYAFEPSTWDGTFMSQFRSISSAEAAARGQQKPIDTTKVPLVSVADMNLALYQSAFRDFAPFSKYVQDDLPSFYSGCNSEGLVGSVDLKALTLVSDGWYPPLASADYLDLDNPLNQPFPPNMTGPAGGPLLGDVMRASSPGQAGPGKNASDRIRNRISGLGMAMLGDYLDQDNVPVSLSIPQVERTPMIVGIEPQLSGSTLNIQATPSAQDIDTMIKSPTYANVEPGASLADRTVRYEKKYFLTQDFAGALGSSVKALVAYPFRRGRDTVSNESFPLDGHVALFLSTGNFRFRTNNTGSLLRLTDDGDGNLGAKNQNQVAAGFGILHAQIGRNTRCTLPDVDPEGGTAQELAKANNVVSLVNVDGDMQFAQDAYSKYKDLPVLTITYSQAQERHPLQPGEPIDPNAPWNNSGAPTAVDAVCGIRPIGPDGKEDPDFADKAKLLDWLSKGEKRPVSVRAAVWLRVRNGSSRTVDLVPACLDDDLTYLNVDNNNSLGPAGSDDLGSAFPVMHFVGGSFDFCIGSAQGTLDSFTPVPLEFKTPGGKKGVLCPDPRWNWAPEHWYASDTITKDQWLQDVRSFMDSDRTRDQDIFMATSDAGYLQSVYELAFLPRVTKFDERMTDHNYDGLSIVIQSPIDNALMDYVAAPANVRNVDYMWRTYCPYDRNGRDHDLFEEIGVMNVGNGVKVNPYSDDTNVVMAAFANTPFDWWAASTNRTSPCVSQGERTNARTFNTKYAFNALTGGEGPQFAWKDLKRVARNFIVRLREGMRSGGDFSWEDAYDWLDWSGTFGHSGDAENYFCTPRTASQPEYDDEPLASGTDPLLGVDRKFLYGYWRECFAAQQQLFLVFVRAEPMMIGGGAVGRTPPALGARAVALVWRDPNPTQEDCGFGSQPRPHRTRILFYRQFD